MLGIHCLMRNAHPDTVGCRLFMHICSPQVHHSDLPVLRSDDPVHEEVFNATQQRQVPFLERCQAREAEIKSRAPDFELSEDHIFLVNEELWFPGR